MVHGALGILGIADVAGEHLLVAIGRDRGLTEESLESMLLRSEGRGALLVVGKRHLIGVSEHVAVDAVDDGGHAVVQGTAGVRDGQDRRDLQGAGDDGGVGGAAADLGNDADYVLFVDGGGHGRGEVVHHDDAARRKRGEIDHVAAEQLGEDAGADVGDIGARRRNISSSMLRNMFSNMVLVSTSACSRRYRHRWRR